MQRGGKRILNQLIEISLGWVETLDGEELQKLAGFNSEEDILSYFNKDRKQTPRYALSVRIDELNPADSVTLTILHTPSPKSPKQSLGFDTSRT